MNAAMLKSLGGMALMLAATLSVAQEPPQRVELPAPQVNGGKPLMQALGERKSSREFGAGQLPPQVLSNLLWAAFGVNRPGAGGRTAPSAHDRQVIDVYVAGAAGLYRFDAKRHALQAVAAQDIRALTGTQDFVKDAALNLVYVADFARMDAGLSEQDKQVAAAADVGFIGQNVYLYCASEGLATVVRGSIDKAPLAKAMGLKPTQWIVLAQSVGYAKKP